MDMATAPGMTWLGLGVLSIILGFLGVQQGRRTDRVLEAEAENTRILVRELHASTKAFIATLSVEHAEILKRFSAR